MSPCQLCVQGSVGALGLLILAFAAHDHKQKYKFGLSQKQPLEQDTPLHVTVPRCYNSANCLGIGSVASTKALGVVSCSPPTRAVCRTSATARTSAAGGLAQRSEETRCGPTTAKRPQLRRHQTPGRPSTPLRLCPPCYVTSALLPQVTARLKVDVLHARALHFEGGT